MTDGPPYLRAAAIAVAQELRETLAPLCVRIAVAGSLRVNKHVVGDVELLYISQVAERPADLFPANLSRWPTLRSISSLMRASSPNAAARSAHLPGAPKTSSPCIAEAGSRWTSLPPPKKTSGTIWFAARGPRPLMPASPPLPGAGAGNGILTARAFRAESKCIALTARRRSSLLSASAAAGLASVERMNSTAQRFADGRATRLGERRRRSPAAGPTPEAVGEKINRAKGFPSQPAVRLPSP
jgi:hypothetical protein